MELRRQADESRRDMRDEYVRTHPRLDAEVRSAMLEERPAIGMTADELRLAIGSPTDVNRTVTASHVHEQWVYETRGIIAPIRVTRTFFVYLDDGVVTAWQD